VSGGSADVTCSDDGDFFAHSFSFFEELRCVVGGL
jgi:hypothetical protein